MLRPTVNKGEDCISSTALLIEMIHCLGLIHPWPCQTLSENCCCHTDVSQPQNKSNTNIHQDIVKMDNLSQWLIRLYKQKHLPSLYIQICKHLFLKWITRLEKRWLWAMTMFNFRYVCVPNLGGADSYHGTGVYWSKQWSRFIFITSHDTSVNSSHSSV